MPFFDQLLLIGIHGSHESLFDNHAWRWVPQTLWAGVAVLQIQKQPVEKSLAVENTPPVVVEAPGLALGAVPVTILQVIAQQFTH
jgi:hypothetical protein